MLLLISIASNGEDDLVTLWPSRFRFREGRAVVFGSLFADAMPTFFFVFFCFVFLLNPRPFVESFFNMCAPHKPRANI